VFLSGDSGVVEKSLNFHILDIADSLVNEVLKFALNDFFLL
jgi:hypothetical protein